MNDTTRENPHEDTRGVWVPLWMIKEAPSPAAAVLLAQIAWLFQPGLRGADRARFTERRGGRWLALSDHELAEQISASVDAVYRARLALRKAGLIECATAKVEGVKRSLVKLAIESQTEASDTAESRDSHDAEPRDSQYRDPAVCTSTVSAIVERVEPSAAAPLKATDEPVKRAAHALTVRAFDMPAKPVVRGDGTAAFPAVMAIFERLLRAGTPVNALTEAVEGEFVTVWTIAGIQTAVAQSRGRPKQNAGERRMAKAAVAVGLDPAGVKADTDAFIASMFDHGKSGDRPLNSDRVIDTTAKGDQ